MSRRLESGPFPAILAGSFWSSSICFLGTRIFSHVAPHFSLFSHFSFSFLHALAMLLLHDATDQLLIQEFQILNPTGSPPPSFSPLSKADLPARDQRAKEIRPDPVVAQTALSFSVLCVFPSSHFHVRWYF